MSEYVVHFTKEQTGLQGAYDVMLKILGQGHVEARGCFGAARHLDAPSFSQAVACFSEIPLDRLDRLVEQRKSQFGIGFRQDFLISAGGGRVWYLDNDSPPTDAFQAVLKLGMSPLFDRDHPIWRLTPFVDFPGEYNDTPYRFEWEREWRVSGGADIRPEPGRIPVHPRGATREGSVLFQGC